MTVYSPFFSLVIASENSFTKVSGVFQPRSPPLAPDPGSLDSLASDSKPSPFFRRSMICLASSSDSTRMWRALYSWAPLWAESLTSFSYSALTSASVTGDCFSSLAMRARISTSWRICSSCCLTSGVFSRPRLLASCTNSSRVISSSRIILRVSGVSGRPCWARILTNSSTREEGMALPLTTAAFCAMAGLPSSRPADSRAAAPRVRLEKRPEEDWVIFGSRKKSGWKNEPWSVLS